MASTLIFVDPTVADYQTLIQDVGATADVIVLDPSQDGILQISQVLAERTGVTSVQIVSHGSAGQLYLGTGILDRGSIESYAAALEAWRTALTPDADILLFGCDVARTAEGEALVDRLGELTGADIAASQDLTGSAVLGGDWDLEWTTGAIETASALSLTGQQAYTSTLIDVLVGSASELVTAINAANTQAGSHIIRISGTIDLSGLSDANNPQNALPVINSNITFIGSTGSVINAGGQKRAFQVNGGTVRFSGFRITGGAVTGATGAQRTNGGAGGAAFGGGLYITGGNVTLVGMNFVSNQASGGNGGTGTSGRGGAGGSGQGGAVYISGGTLRISTSNFSNNTARGGTGGTGTTGSGTGGSAQGGAIFAANTATVEIEGTPSYSGNQVTAGSGGAASDADFSGNFDPLTISRATIALGSAETTTAATSITFTITFKDTEGNNTNVNGLNQSDLQLVTAALPNATPALQGATITSVTPDGNSSVYTVTVNTGTGNGTIALKLRDDDSIINGDGVPIGGTGNDNGETTSSAYTIDKRPPYVTSIDGVQSSPTAADTLTYEVIFNEFVLGVDKEDFALVEANGVTGGSVDSVRALNPRSGDGAATTYEVKIKTGTGNGTIALKLNDNDSIKNTRGVALGTVGGTADGSLTGEIYTVNKTPPVVAGVNRAPGAQEATADSTVSYQVTFSQNVSGVDTLDFALTTGGVTGASVSSVTKVDDKTYTVVVNTGSGDGTIGLELKDNNSIKNELGVALASSISDDGSFTGQTYRIVKSAPLVSGITQVNPNPTAAGVVNYTITFNQDVTGVDTSDFVITPVGITGASITEITGAGKTYNVAINTGTGSGSINLSLIDDDSIKNTIDAPLGGVGAGNGNSFATAYTINKTPPRVTSISRLESNPTNAASINFAVIFNENVNRVDAADFQLVTQGISGASITSVTRVNGSFYTVAVSTGNGNGTIGLRLVDNDSIISGTGVVLGGTGANNGNFNGEVYNIDKNTPTVDIIDVAPDPRRDTVNGITLQFSEAVKGLDISDLKLTRDDKAIDLKNASLTSSNGITWTLDNIKKLVNRKGDYNLSLTASGSDITDLAGNPLKTNASDRWTNQVTVEVFEPGITRRGTDKADTLTGTDGWDTLEGLGGNDTLIGLDLRDRLVGGAGNDRAVGDGGGDSLIGGGGDDLLEGGAGADEYRGGGGADRFIFAGINQAAALSTSTVEDLDRIIGFKFSQKDKIRLDFDGNPRTFDRPKGLFNAGTVKGKALENAAAAAYADKNRSASGKQALGSGEAVFFKWKSRVYLSVNDASAGFSATNDLVVALPGIGFKSGDANAGVLAVNDYFG